MSKALSFSPIARRRLCAAIALAWVGTVRAQAAGSCPALLQHTLPRLQDEKPQDLCQYSGKVLLVVNTASYCGFTGQYKALETLAQRYADRGLVVLGVPSNDFAQEPGSNKDIAEFCENTFNVKFPMFAKSSTRPDRADSNPLIVALAKRSGKAPSWNFHKYLVSRDGRQVLSFGSMTDPLSSNFVRELERLLVHV
jgi:glutathione peroxidase